MTLAKPVQQLRVFVTKGYGPKSDDLNKSIAAPSQELAQKFCEGVLEWESFAELCDITEDFPELSLDDLDEVMDEDIEIALGPDGRVVAGSLYRI